MNQADLFEEYRPEDSVKTALFFLPENSESAETGQIPADLFELSVEAFYAVLYARMSELPINREIARYIVKVGGAKDRDDAAVTAFDRGDRDTLTVLKASRKVQHEIHRLNGFLRFRPEADGVYTARCAPDHFVLPALAAHFTLRFGEIPWAIIDEKRRLRLERERGGAARLIPVPGPPFPEQTIPAAPSGENPGDFWEKLWRLYHRSVNNEQRNNPRLQRQFMPERYQKYLTELQ